MKRQGSVSVRNISVVVAGLLCFVAQGARAQGFEQHVLQISQEASVMAQQTSRALAAKSQDMVFATLYQRLFDLRDQKNKKQREVDVSQSRYRDAMNSLKAIYPRSSEASILETALGGMRGDDEKRYHQHQSLSIHYRELNGMDGVNGLLRDIRDIDGEIAFVQERIAQYSLRVSKKS